MMTSDVVVTEKRENEREREREREREGSVIIPTTMLSRVKLKILSC
jgi:hypothetical protein